MKNKTVKHDDKKKMDTMHQAIELTLSDTLECTCNCRHYYHALAALSNIVHMHACK